VVDGGRAALSEKLTRVDARDAFGRPRDHLLVEPAGVLDALVVVQELHEVEGLARQSGRDHRVAAALGVGADEGERAQCDAKPPRPHVAPDDGRQQLRLELPTVRALQIDVLDKRGRRGRRAERQTVLPDASEKAVRVRGARKRAYE
jgi:hypothetical protein